MSAPVDPGRIQFASADEDFILRRASAAVRILRGCLAVPSPHLEATRLSKMWERVSRWSECAQRLEWLPLHCPVPEVVTLVYLTLVMAVYAPKLFSGSKARELSDRVFLHIRYVPAPTTSQR